MRISGPNAEIIDCSVTLIKLQFVGNEAKKIDNHHFYADALIWPACASGASLGVFCVKNA
jgi:hypothetical protein